jgi:hypothetical protein
MELKAPEKEEARLQNGKTPCQESSKGKESTKSATILIIKETTPPRPWKARRTQQHANQAENGSPKLWRKKWTKL